MSVSPRIIKSQIEILCLFFLILIFELKSTSFAEAATPNF